MKPDLTTYPRHRIRTRGATFHAIPVDIIAINNQKTTHGKGKK
jgi:hypothetical protein